jgi:phosphoglucomutase
MKSHFDSQLKFEKLKSVMHTELCNYIKNEYYSKSGKSVLVEINNLTDNILINMKNWFQDEIPEEYKKIILKHIDEKNWNEIIEAFKQKLIFGTSGVRGKLITSLDNDDSEKDLLSLNKFGFSSNILRGSNSINEITIAKNIIGLINYMKKNNMSKIIIGYDSRISSKLFAILASNLFIKNNILVILFEEPNTLPELSFAVTHFKADLGIEITASHNDKRYNGYKIITKNGSPPPINFKEDLTLEIFNDSNNLLNQLKDLLQNNILDFDSEKLSIIKKPPINNSKDYSIDYLHNEYLKQLIKLISNKKVIEKYSSVINIGYSALHGTGYDISSHLFEKLGINNIKYISKMILPDSLFPFFPMKQILDPSDTNTAKIVVNLFIQQYGSEEFNKLDFLCYTDPDADRLGIIVPTSINEQSIYGPWKLLKANDVWTLFLWYMLEILSKKNNSISYDLKNSFIVKSYVTSDSLIYLSKKYGLECLEGKVGFSDLTSIVMNEWKKNKTNIGMFEESYGFGLAGNQDKKLHILEKDGMLSLTLLVEIVAYTKSQNVSIQDILNNIYLDPEIGYFATIRKELPTNDVFEGINGELFLRKILKNVEKLYDKCVEQINLDSPLLICNLPISSVKKFSTGKYDELFWKGFPDEGIRFFLDSEINHITIRSSGTEPKLRIFVQYRVTDLDKNNLFEKKDSAEYLVKELSNEMDKMINSY